MSSKFQNIISQARHRQTEISDETIPGTVTEPLEPSASAPNPPTITDADIASNENSTKSSSESAVTSEATRGDVRTSRAKTKAGKGLSSSKESRNSRLKSPQSNESATDGVEQHPSRTPGKSRHPDYVQITAYIRRKIHQNTKVALLIEGADREISTLIDELLEQWLQKQRNSNL